MYSDEYLMKKAIECGQKARIQAPPNPWVGCVITKNHQIIGEGFTSQAGGPHAEVNALAQTSNAEDSLVYVTLEPCSHYGKTPPCTSALIKAKVKKVFIALEDPDPKVKGKGIQALREAGIEVEVGLCHQEAYLSLEPYLFQRVNARPYCICKAAISMDGGIAAADGSSQWITTSALNSYNHHLRACSQAIVIGSRTANQDQPQLTVREGELPPHQPLRVILDSTGKTKATGSLFKTSKGSTLIFTTEKCPPSTLQEWKNYGVEWIKTKLNDQEQVNLHEVLAHLFQRGIIQVLVEGGGQIHTSFLKENLYNKFEIFIGPKILGSDSQRLFPNFFTFELANSLPLRLKEVKQIENNAILTYENIRK